jgi:hypothetical protein
MAYKLLLNVFAFKLESFFFFAIQLVTPVMNLRFWQHFMEMVTDLVCQIIGAAYSRAVAVIL